jgi:hypothetical protein
MRGVPAVVEELVAQALRGHEHELRAIVREQVEQRLAALVDALVVEELHALGFTILSFWWLHARTGSLEAAAPRAYGFASLVRLRLPLAFFNTGAKALIVSDLRLLLDDEEREPLPWIITRRTMRAAGDDHAYATPFAVPGRGLAGPLHGLTPPGAITSRVSCVE